MKNYLLPGLLLITLAFADSVKAAKVDTVNTYSDSMHKNIKAIVITPDGYEQGTVYPVVYLLHGAGGNYKQYLGVNPGITKLADYYHMMIVLADGNNTSWYWDSPIDPTSKYETYIYKELVGFIDKNYKTIKNRTGRAISGLSMGGQGAMYLSFRHQDVFGAVGSMSGGVDIRPFPKNWDMAKRLGSYAENPDVWEKTAVVNQVYLLTANSLAITFDCGTEDFFHLVNQNLHNLLLERNIPHEYIERPGAHNNAYWSNSINYHLLFFNTFFKKNNPQLN